MRRLMKVTIPIQSANKAVNDGSAKRILQTEIETLRPEAATFTPVMNTQDFLAD